ncbi:hypothetical protein [Actinacidiphila yeochonensis]|uniref:hypothetical protein n=1 Tax=Actinacidiphila yeochonensis TaxID=89050 RepID=UPI000AE5CB8D|nr:hypothetical protein [Actinacidiphila yeochonensis]
MTFAPPADDDDEPEVTREAVERDRKAAAASARDAQRKALTRRSWYVSTGAAETFQAAVDDIHHTTRLPKHLVVAALLEAAAGQADRVQKALILRQARSHQSHE